MSDVTTGPEIIAVLRGAADYMETHGKCVYQFEREDGAVCALGSIYRCGWRQAEVVEATEAAFHRWVVGLVPHPDRRFRWGGVAQWSDWNTQEEVVAGLRACANQLEAKSAAVDLELDLSLGESVCLEPV